MLQRAQSLVEAKVFQRARHHTGENDSHCW